MKTIKTASIALSLFLLLGNAKADRPKIHAYSNMKFSVSTFINADVNGVVDGLADIIDDNAKFNTIHAGHVLSFNKKQMVNFMQTLEGIKLNCTSKYDIVEAHGYYVLIKVEMKFPTFSRFNYITLNENKDGWKITNVSSVYDK